MTIDKSLFTQKILHHPCVSMTRNLSKNGTLPNWILVSRSVNILLGQRQSEYQFGFRGRVVRWLLTPISNSTLATSLLFFVLTAITTFNWLRKGRKEKKEPANRPFRIFVRHGAGAEKSLIKTYTKMQPEVPVRTINYFEPESFAKISELPSIWQISKLLWNNSVKAIKSINQYCQENPSIRLELYTHAIIHLPSYVCSLGWWQNFSRKDAAMITEVCFLLSCNVACSYLDSGLTIFSRYFQHGTLSVYWLYLKFDRITALNSYEALFLENSTGTSDVSIIPTKKKVSGHKGVVIFASTYDTTYFQRKNNMEVLSSWIDWCSKRNLDFLVSLHPLEDRYFWEQNFTETEIITNNGSIEDILHNYRPIFLASWYSTSIIESYNCGVIPVILESEQGSLFCGEIIYPMRDIFPIWPQDRLVLENMVNNTEQYQQWLDIGHKGAYHV